MRVSTLTVRLALVAGAALAVAGCGSRPAATNTAANAASVANDLSAPMNDASAVETVSNASTAPAPSNMTNPADTAPIAPPSGNSQVQSNVAGM
jgi:hypothetical protein